MRLLKDFTYYLYVLVYDEILFWEVCCMGILIATKLSSIRQNFAFHFWRYFERIFDSNVIIHSNLSREKVLNEEKTSKADNGKENYGLLVIMKKIRKFHKLKLALIFRLGTEYNVQELITGSERKNW